MNYFADYRVYYGMSTRPGWELAHDTEDLLTLKEITNERLAEVLACEHSATECEILIYRYDGRVFYRNSDLPLVYRIFISDTELYRPLKRFNTRE